MMQETSKKQILRDPVHFSNYFEIDSKLLDDAFLFDPILNCDTLLFVDPLLFNLSENSIIKEKGLELLKARYSEVIKLLHASKVEGDIPWRSAYNKLDLNEAHETCLGFGSKSGIGRPRVLRQSILKTAKDIITIGFDDPEIISLMGVFETGVGPDTISDLSTNYIKPLLAEMSSEFCLSNSIKTKTFSKYGGLKLTENPFKIGTPILLVPKDILRHIPTSVNQNDIKEVMRQNEDIRDQINQVLGDVAKATISQIKAATKKVALKNTDNLKSILESFIDVASKYDQNEDIVEFNQLRTILSQSKEDYIDCSLSNLTTDRDGLIKVVTNILQLFKRQIETNNLWEILWHEGVPRRERMAQLLLFAVADSYCKANDIDISPETNPGGGPVDFKFSKGYNFRAVVEVKLSKGKVVSGYKKQLEIYKSASNTDIGFFLLLDVGSMGNKLKDILSAQREMRLNGGKSSEIIIIDAMPKKSASLI